MTTAEVLHARVNNRNLEHVAFDIQTFAAVRKLLVGQNKQRLVVSTAVLIKLAIPNFEDARTVILEHSTSAEILPSIRSSNWVPWTSHLEFLLELEATRPHMLPAFIDVMSVKSFSTLDWDNRLRMVDHIDKCMKLSLTRESVKAVQDFDKTANLPDLQRWSPVRDVRSLDGAEVLTELREDDYVNLSMLARTLGTTYRDFLRAEPNARYCASFTVPGKQVIDAHAYAKFVEVWGHPLVAVRMIEGLETPYAEYLKSVLPDGPPTEDAPESSTRHTAMYDEKFQALSGTDFSTARRESDGYINASKLSRSLDVLWKNRSTTLVFRTFVDRFSKKSMIPVSGLIVPTSESIWVHPVIAVKFADSIKEGCGRALQALMDAPFQADEAYRSVKDADGQSITTRRSSDSFINAGLILKNSKVKVPLSNLMKNARVAAIAAAVEKCCGAYSKSTPGACTWVHEKIAAELAVRCGLDIPELKENELSDSRLDEDSEASCSQQAPEETTWPSDTDLDDGVLLNDDGMVNATLLCKRGGKQFAHWTEGSKTKIFLKTLSAELGVDIETLMSVSRGGSKRGSWVHPRVATRIAQWISEEFAVKATGWIEDAKAKIPGINAEYERALEDLKGERNSQVELEVRQRLALEVDGAQAVANVYGEIDILSDQEVIEVKWAPKFLHALGQILGYGESYPTKGKRVHLFGSAEEVDRVVAKGVSALFSSHGVTLTTEVVDEAM